MHYFKANLNSIGINPFVFVPEVILSEIFKAAERDKSPIPVQGEVNGKPFTQTLVKYKGAWRLYINTEMLKDSPQRIGEEIEICIGFDAKDRSIAPHPKLVKALNENLDAKEVFDGLSPSRQKEIVKYISFLKTEESIDKNVKRAIGFLRGENSFVGRAKP